MATKQITVKVCDNCSRQEDDEAFFKVLELDLCPVCHIRLFKVTEITYQNVSGERKPFRIKLAGYTIYPATCNGAQYLYINKDPECS